MFKTKTFILYLIGLTGAGYGNYQLINLDKWMVKNEEYDAYRRLDGEIPQEQFRKIMRACRKELFGVITGNEGGAKWTTNRWWPANEIMFKEWENRHIFPLRQWQPKNLINFCLGEYWDGGRMKNVIKKISLKTRNELQKCMQPDNQSNQNVRCRKIELNNTSPDKIERRLGAIFMMARVSLEKLDSKEKRNTWIVWSNNLDKISAKHYLEGEDWYIENGSCKKKGNDCNWRHYEGEGAKEEGDPIWDNLHAIEGYDKGWKLSDKITIDHNSLTGWMSEKNLYDSLTTDLKKDINNSVHVLVMRVVNQKFNEKEDVVIEIGEVVDKESLGQLGLKLGKDAQWCDTKGIADGAQITKVCFDIDLTDKTKVDEEVVEWQERLKSLVKAKTDGDSWAYKLGKGDKWIMWLPI